MFHILNGEKTNQMVRDIHEWIQLGRGEHGQHFTPESFVHRIIFVGMMKTSSKGPKGGTALERVNLDHSILLVKLVLIEFFS